MPKDRKQTGKDSRRERQQMNIKLPCWGIYLRLLLGWMRSCCTAASAAAMAAPASSRWVWVTLVLLWLRDGPWDRRWPSDDDFELPGLLWDFSMVGTCMSGYKRIKHELKLLPVSPLLLKSSPHITWNCLKCTLMFSFMGQLCNFTPYSNAIKIWKAIQERKQREWSLVKGLIHLQWVVRSLRQWMPGSACPFPSSKTIVKQCLSRLEDIVNSLSQETEKVWVQRSSQEREGECDFYANHLPGGWAWQSWNVYMESKHNTKHRHKSSSTVSVISGSQVH